MAAAVSPPAAELGAPSPALEAPPGQPRFPLFDGLRGVAVLGVLAFHVTEMTGRLGMGPLGRWSEMAGGEAVIVFFAISGFLLYRPFLAARAAGLPAPRLGGYLRRRALRILPAYWGILTLLALYPGIRGPFSGQWWRYYGYLQLYSTRTENRGIPVAWTLCVEVSFYLALPVWAWMLRRLPCVGSRLGWLRVELAALGLVALGGAAVQLAAARQKVPYVLGVSLLGQCTWLCVGMAIAALSVARGPARAGRLSGRPGACWGGAILCGVALSALVPRGGLFGLVAGLSTVQPAGRLLARLALEAALAALLILPAVFGGMRDGWPRRLLAAGPLVWLGVVSYSFYLWHLTVAELIALPAAPGAFSARGLGLVSHLSVLRSGVLLVVVLAVAGALSALSYRWLELPFLRRKQAHCRRP